MSYTNVWIQYAVFIHFHKTWNVNSSHIRVLLLLETQRQWYAGSLYQQEQCLFFWAEWSQIVRILNFTKGLFGTRFSLMSLSSSTDDVNSIRSRSSMALNLPQVAEFLNDDDLAQVIDRAKKDVLKNKLKVWFVFLTMRLFAGYYSSTNFSFNFLVKA